MNRNDPARPADEVPRVKLCECLIHEQPGPYIVKEKDVLDDTAGADDGVPIVTPGRSFLVGRAPATPSAYPASESNPVILFDDFTTAFRWIDFPFKVKSSAVKILKPKPGVNFRYVYHAMRSLDFRPSYHARHWISRHSRLEIPYPSEEVQRRIVETLDDMEHLVATLERELVLREEQIRILRSRLIS